MLKNSKVFFISVTLKRWSGRKLFDPTMYTANSHIINTYFTKTIKGRDKPQHRLYIKHANNCRQINIRWAKICALILSL